MVKVSLPPVRAALLSPPRRRFERVGSRSPTLTPALPQGSAPPARIPQSGRAFLFVGKLPHGSAMIGTLSHWGCFQASSSFMAPNRPANPSLLSSLPEHLATDLFRVTILSRAGSERILACLGKGAIVGELSIIDGLPRSATVVAVRDAALSFLSRAAFEDFAKHHPEIYKYLVTLLAT